MPENPASADYDASEFGVRFLPPHVSAGEVIGPFDLPMAVTFLRDCPAELVERQVSPWVTLCRCAEPSGDGDGPYVCERHRVPWPETRVLPPAKCNCGWGGVHDPDNPRCVLNGATPSAV